MKTLYFNPQTNVIFASEDTQDSAIQTITADQVPDLIANGATVDSSADSLVGNVGAVGASAADMSITAPVQSSSVSAQQDNTSSTTQSGDTASDSSVEAGNVSSATSSASAATPVTNNPTTEDTVVPTTNTPVSAVPAPSDVAGGASSGMERAEGNSTLIGDAPAALAPDASATTSDTVADVGNGYSGKETAGSISDASATANDSASTQSVSGASLETDSASNLSPSQTDTAAADASVPLDLTTPPVTDSVTSNPTGGPTAGSGATPTARAHHALLDRLEEDLRSSLNAIAAIDAEIAHVLAAVFDRHHSTVDVEAVS